MVAEPEVGGGFAPATVIARLLDMTERQVYYHARNGVIPLPVAKRYEVIPCVQGYIRFLRKRGGGNDGNDNAAPSSKDLLLAARARKALREADLLDGLVLEKSVVGGAWVALATLVRTALLALPSRVAPLIEAAPGLAAIHAILTEAVHDILAALASTPVYAAEPEADRPAWAGGNGDDDAADADAAAEVDGEPVG
jgi:hypothetical protein